ncbi:SOS response-associated peptidase [bacterium]|jgi:putative SOS response-associated peptidase YedK|nr:SOS response-associated peptidase [bacterium]
MCGRYTLKTPAERVAELFGIEPLTDLVPRYNIAPAQPIALVRQKEIGLGREMVWGRWGLVPSWAKDSSGAARAINARSESAREKPSFRSSFARRRCLVPADGFFEWKADGKKKNPFYVRFDDGRLFAMAGLWDRWNKDGSSLETATILTTAASSGLRSLHDRMPVILPPDRYDDWLTGRAAEEILVSMDDPHFVPIPVSSVVNSARHEGPDCIAPADPQTTDGQPTLW